MISYLELLQMVKDGNAPELIWLHLDCGSTDYQAYYDGGEFDFYGICDDKYIGENFKYYLADTLLESQMIEPNIEIVYQNDNKIEMPSLEDRYYKLLLENEGLKKWIDKLETQEEPKKIKGITWNEKSQFNGGTISKIDKMLMSRTEQLKKSINEITKLLNSKED